MRVGSIIMLLLAGLFGIAVVYRDLTFEEKVLSPNTLQIPQEFKDCIIGKGMVDGSIIYLARCEGKSTTTVNEFHRSGKTTKHTTTITVN